MFKALLVEQIEGQSRSRLAKLDESLMPEGEVIVRIEYSTLNYKDGLAITGKAPVVRKFPMVPGIDFAGTVEESAHPDFTAGDKVILNGWGVGETHWGGLAQKAKVPGKWLLPLPSGINTREAMSIGTAGYTAMLCVRALMRHGVTPDKGEVIVTGANGGVGSIAIAILARRGFKVVASTGRVHEADYLRHLGAAEIVDRASLSIPGKPLIKERWAGAVDSVGSHTLANVCAGMRYGGVVTACGLAQGMDFTASVAPFILRAVSLIGIDSVYAPLNERKEAWIQLANEIPDVLSEVVHEIALSEAAETAAALLRGEVRGRVVVDVNA